VIHVAGTNGKTSTARIAESLLRAHGLRTGLFTSPHLHSVRERIAVDGQGVSAAAFVEAWEQVGPICELVDRKATGAGQKPMTFFEVLTVLGFVIFADAPVDVAVIEVGLGGTWDATNVVNSNVQVITPIARDHEAWLGTDLRDIAREKAGIIKSDAVIAAQRGEVAQVLEEAVIAAGATALWQDVSFGVVSREMAVGGQVVTIRTVAGEYRDLFLPLHGPHQASNAALALTAVELLLAGPDAALAEAVVRESLEKVTSPGRLELVRNSPTVRVDAAHNVAGAQALVEALDEFYPSRLVGLVGILNDKDAEGILGVLEPILTMVVVSRSSSPRAMDVDRLAEIARAVFGPDRVEAIESLDEALARAMDLAEQDTGENPGALATSVIATGSVTIAAEVRILLGLGTPDA
jgi:dihydrofolate synthase/folylpolyglutamate synthase